mmetsp:Transcript_104733/g.322996  ORF Transcript_104733/g.322996 Transcript_104733/m.322996 type:complete len:408 (-) Transcript_104733:2-1225(-)
MGEGPHLLVVGVHQASQQPALHVCDHRHHARLERRLLEAKLVRHRRGVQIATGASLAPFVDMLDRGGQSVDQAVLRQRCELIDGHRNCPCLTVLLDFRHVVVAGHQQACQAIGQGILGSIDHAEGHAVVCTHCARDARVRQKDRRHQLLRLLAGPVGVRPEDDAMLWAPLSHRALEAVDAGEGVGRGSRTQQRRHLHRLAALGPNAELDAGLPPAVKVVRDHLQGGGVVPAVLRQVGRDLDPPMHHGRAQCHGGAVGAEVVRLGRACRGGAPAHRTVPGLHQGCHDDHGVAERRAGCLSGHEVLDGGALLELVHGAGDRVEGQLCIGQSVDQGIPHPHPEQIGVLLGAAREDEVARRERSPKLGVQACQCQERRPHGSQRRRPHCGGVRMGNGSLLQLGWDAEQHSP